MLKHFTKAMRRAIKPLAARPAPCEQAEPPAELFEFDADYYLYANLDVRASGMDPRTHYLEFGRKEGRRPSLDAIDPEGRAAPMPPELTGFDADYYLANNPDVREVGVDPRVHYLLYGREEGRSPSSGSGASDEEVRETETVPFVLAARTAGGARAGEDKLHPALARRQGILMRRAAMTSLVLGYDLQPRAD